MDFHVGQTFGDYTITAIVGAGSMGRVYQVENRLTKRMEAMKVLTAELASEVQVKRFEREVRVQARLNHPNIAALHNAFHSDKQLILLMEYIAGRTLESMFQEGRLPMETGVGYIKQVLHALQHAHQQGVVHRDVTPANVMISLAGEAKLTDFGLSKSYGDSLLTNCGEILGSLPYMAPEQLKGVTQPDRRSDVYSVGAILYEHLTGKKPFGTHRRLAPVITDSEADPEAPSQVDPSLSPEWDDIIRRSVAKDPAHRYESAEEFLGAIAQLEGATPELRLPKVHPLGIGAAIAAGVILALAGAAAPRFYSPVAPIAVPVSRLHIKPPAFAADLTPRPAIQVKAQHSRRSAPVVVARRIETPAVPQRAPEPAPVVTQAAAQQPATTQQSKSFWSKLNVFKKKKSAEGEEK